MSIGPMIISWIRTIVPAVVGMILTALADAGLEFSEGEITALSVVIFTAVTSIYYLAVRWLETNVSSTIGVLLGVPRRPTYTPAVDA